MPRLLLFAAILAVAVVIYALIDCVMSRKHEVRSISKTAWFLTILVLPLIGAGMWFLFGRPRKQGPSGPRRPSPRQPTAPDDDPAFLQNLEAQRWQRAREEERRRREQEQKEREAKAREVGKDSPAPEDKHDGEGNDDAGSGPAGAHHP
ncbi:PLD nuclease N-terminal domain-containing protein [Arthrobacter sp. B0490]|uniref:PLD nuclease N-terminal domain-containing protein n=1 Tax=Arthrobacter sp. B0490 TaxID=2058891 RepID=UPI000CE49E83|nr:PLD nuclease N-terminal domain-containing protein [Arthrobacter sp. B0490]